jgi:lipoic acid synthetase
MKPDWLKTRIPTGQTYFEIKRDLRAKNLYTVCEEAKCPNIGECWGTNTATFMILGDTCTRACRFCHVKTGDPQGWLDPHEPEQVATSVATMRLKYAVITMVDRDDLPDGGAAHAARVFQTIMERSPETVIEFLAGDFRGKDEPLATVLNTGIEVFAHNIETVARLSPRVRDARASYKVSLRQLARAKELASYHLYTKSALMLGLGETTAEVIEALKDLRRHGVDFVTLGQYMRPTKKHLSIKEYVHPDLFDELAEVAKDLGFLSVASGPLVRSSYRAREFYEKAVAGHRPQP